jgi:RNA polymerase sigma-70 factor (sigma-E family)
MQIDLQEFIRARYPALLRRAYLLEQDHHAAEDLVQEALARSCRAWGKRAADNPDAYVVRVMVNLHTSKWRRRRPAETSTAVLPEVGVSDGTQERSEADHLWRALAEAPPRQRAVLVLRYYEGMTESEAADVLGVTVGTIRSQTSKALANLRIALADASANAGCVVHRHGGCAGVCRRRFDGWSERWAFPGGW